MFNLGIPFEADESLTLETMGKFMSAFNDGLERLTQRGDTPQQIRVWRGHLLLKGKTVGYDYVVICPQCPFANSNPDQDGLQ